MIYDNGEIVLGKVKDLRKYLAENCEDYEEVKDIIDELKYFKDDNIIVAINYDNGMGYTIDWWTNEHKVILKEEK